MLCYISAMHVYVSNIFVYTSSETGGMKENMKLRGLFERFNNVAVGQITV